MLPKLSPPPSTPPLASTPRPPATKPSMGTSRPLGIVAAAAIGVATGGCTMAIGRSAYRVDAGADAPASVADAGVLVYDGGVRDASPADPDAQP